MSGPFTGAQCNADSSLSEAFARVAAAHPSRIALVSDLWQPNYAELNATANRLAHAIVARGGASGDRLAILMQHDAPAVAALLAAWKAGRIAVVLDPAHPRARLRELLADAGPTALLVDAVHRPWAAEIAPTAVSILDYGEHCAAGPTHDPSIRISPRQAALLAYTSGSSGKPKAVMMTHRLYLRNVIVLTDAVGYCVDDRLPLFGSLSNGEGITMTCSALLNGATLCPFAVAVRGVTGLLEWLRERRITVLASTASVFRQFIATIDPGYRFDGIRAVRLTGEAATANDFRLFQRYFPADSVFVVTFSTSEVGNIAWSRRSVGDSVAEGALPVGAMSPGHDVSLRDDDGRPVAPGEIGEIVVRSRYVAGGYWRDPALTAVRFSDELDADGTRVVRTGDLGRINAEGFLEFRGRTDDLVKVRGRRIELGEIRGALRQLPGVDDAVVEAIERPGREPVLAGFVTMLKERPWSAAEARRSLRGILPDYMVPSNIIRLEQFPLTPSGKVDRDKLRQDYLAMREPQSGEAPATETESLLAAIWAKTLNQSAIGCHDDFFELGGDSLIAAVVAAEVHAATGVELHLVMFADHPTLSGIAALIDERRLSGPAVEEPLVRVLRDRPLPLSFAQERAWELSQTDGRSHSETYVNRYRIVGPLDRDLLRDCMSELVRRHENIRTTYTTVDGTPMQIVHDPEPVQLRTFDLAGAPDPERDAHRIFEDAAARPLDLTKLPLWFFVLIRLRDGEHWLLRIYHHIVADAQSSDIYFRELAELYAARRRGETPALPDPPELQYADYATWERKALQPDGSAFQEAIEWWQRSLEGAPPISLPIQRPPAPQPRGFLWRLGWSRPQAPAPVAPADGIARWGLDPELTDRLARLGRAAGATYFVVRLAAFVTLVATELNQRDVLVGTYVSNRNRLPLQSIGGLFINLVALRFFYQPEQSFRQWLAIVRQVVMDAEARSTIPFEILCEELERRGGSRPPIEMIFQLSQNSRYLEFADLKMTWLEPRHESMPWGFSMTVNEYAEQHACSAMFDAHRYDPAEVRAFIERYKRLLDAVSREPDKALDEFAAMGHAAAAP